MTNQEREASESIAKWVFRWKWNPPPKMIHPAKEHHWQPFPEATDEIVKDMRCELPNFAHDVASAMDICERLAGKGWRCVANMGTDGTWEAFFTKGDAHHFGTGETLSSALVEATINLIENGAAL